MTRHASRARWLRFRRALAAPQTVARGIAVAVLVVGLAVTVAAARIAAEYQHGRAQLGFDHRVEQAVSTLSARFSLYLAIAQSGRALFMNAADVGPQEWDQFAAAWRARGAQYPRVELLMFARYFEHGELPTGIELDPPGERDRYCPVVYSYPAPSHPPFPGFDLCTRPVSTVAMMAAREHGEALLTGRVLVYDQDTGIARDGVVIYDPVYRDDGRLYGWTVLPLAIDDVVAEALPGDTALSLRLYDGSVEESRLMYSSGAAAGPDSLTRTVEQVIAGRNWMMRFDEPAGPTDTADLVAVTGTVISVLLLLLLWRAGDLHARAVTLAERMSAAYRQSEERYRTIISSLEDAYFETDLRGNLCYFNDALVRMLGYPRRDLDGMNNRGYMDSDNAAKVYRAFNRIHETGEPERGLQWETIRKDGERRYVEASVSLMRDESGEPTGFRGIARDITDRRRADERIHYLAHYDTLTGLPNRTLFEDRMRQVLKRRWDGDQRAALLYLDLDRFKTINDSLGHHAGDQLLKLVATRIQSCVRDGDTVCRPGGDEFMVLLAELRNGAIAAQVADKILHAVSEPYAVEGWEFSVTPSIGIAVIPDDGDDIDELTRNADTAMYHAKESGRNNFQFFSASMNQNAEKRLVLEHGLRWAVERQELELYYQPIVDGRDGRLVGAEALLRWNRPGHGVVSAGTFIEVVEQSGMILEIGEWVLREACRQAAAWRLPVAVNLSGLQFRQAALVDLVTTALSDAGLDPTLLELEITESVLIEDAYQTAETVSRLRALGVKFSIDDFGTGYSSLSYLKRFPIHRVKIDRSFVRDLTSDPEDAAIIDAIIGMTGSLGLEVVAEGVETEAQRAYLVEHGCTLMQGFLFSKPLPAAGFERLRDDS